MRSLSLRISPRSLVLPALVGVAVVLVALALRGGSSSPAKPAAAGSGAHLTISNFDFAPKALVVKAGTTVTVTNADSTEHTATSQAGGFDTGTLKTGQTAQLTLKTPGTYSYICLFHAFMSGKITVTA